MRSLSHRSTHRDYVMNSRVLDINCDMGESYGSWVKTVKLAKQNGVQIDLGAKYSHSSGLSTNTGLNRLFWYEIIEADRERRDLIVECLNAIPGMDKKKGQK